jgi:nucleotide-binding universal stress UspA family protein
MTQHRELVVGFDGSPDARAALAWAMAEAGTRHLGIRVVQVQPDLIGWGSASAAMAGAPALAAELPAPEDDPAAEAVELATRTGVPARSVVVTGAPAAVLADESRTADLVVIGSRGLGSVSSAVLGSTVAHVAAHAHSPVVVVRAEGPSTGPLVVGVDGSADSEETIGWAFDHASRHGLALEVLHAYTIPVYPGVVPYVPPVELTEATTQYERRVTQEVLAGWQERYPDVAVTASLVHGRAAPALIEATRRATLTVVGSHGRGAFLGMLLGSTSQSLLQHAHGTVAVLRHRRH